MQRHHIFSYRQPLAIDAGRKGKAEDREGKVGESYEISCRIAIEQNK